MHVKVFCFFKYRRVEVLVEPSSAHVVIGTEALVRRRRFIYSGIRKSIILGHWCTQRILGMSMESTLVMWSKRMIPISFL
jgi:hypothetical protein